MVIIFYLNIHISTNNYIIDVYHNWYGNESDIIENWIGSDKGSQFNNNQNFIHCIERPSSKWIWIGEFIFIHWVSYLKGMNVLSVFSALQLICKLCYVYVR